MSCDARLSVAATVAYLRLMVHEQPDAYSPEFKATLERAT